VCNTHADVDDPDIVADGHQWARISDPDQGEVTVCVNCEQVWFGLEPETAVPCPECDADIGKRCRDETSTFSAPVPPHPSRREAAYGAVDGLDRCGETAQQRLVPDGGTARRQAQGTAAQLAGVADQDTACENGTEGCPGPEGNWMATCLDCFYAGGEDGV